MSSHELPDDDAEHRSALVVLRRRELLRRELGAGILLGCDPGNRPTRAVVQLAVKRIAVLLIAAGCGACSSATDTSSSPVATFRVAEIEPSTTASPPVTTIVDVSPVVGQWRVVAATAFDVADRDPTKFPAYLLFADSGDGVGRLTLRGCETGTYPITFKPGPQIAVGRSNDESGCANPFDIGQILPSFLAFNLRWSVTGDELTLSQVGGAGSLTLMPAD